MSEPIPFDQQNTVLTRGENHESVCELPIYRNPDPTPNNLPFMLSCWKFTIPEIEEIQRTGKVWLYVMGEGHPPVSLIAHDPFKPHPGETK